MDRHKLWRIMFYYIPLLAWSLDITSSKDNVAALVTLTGLYKQCGFS